MAYSVNQKTSTIKYIREKQQEIKIRYKKSEFDEYVMPAIKESGLPVATFVKQAINEKILSDAGNTYDNSDAISTIEKYIAVNVPKLLGRDCIKIILYGSYARGDYTADSDIDVAIMTECDRIDAKKYNDDIDLVAQRIGEKTMAVVNFVCLPNTEFEEKKSWYPYFINIDKEGVLLYER